jgi:hypothetical protein
MRVIFRSPLPPSRLLKISELNSWARRIMDAPPQSKKIALAEYHRPTLVAVPSRARL